MNTTHALIALAVTLATSGCAARPQSSTTPAEATAPAPAPDARLAATGKYASVNGLDMYYEVHGTGRPLVLLHGAFCTIEACFGKIIPALAASRQVIAIEQQAHGHTPDIDRPLTIAQMTEDTAALLTHLGVSSADVFGYSMGSGIAVELAIKHPELVNKLVLVSPALNKAGFHPGVLEGIQHITPEAFIGTPFHDAYVKVAPNPDHFSRLVNKIKELDASIVDVPSEAVQAIKAPALIIVGDSDITRPEHAAEMFRLFGGGVAGDLVGLPRSQLSVLPGSTHITVMLRDTWIAQMTSAFLDAPPPATK
jgi:pimeloyl-ACP methyl ester carboxylesterase